MNNCTRPATRIICLLALIGLAENTWAGVVVHSFDDIVHWTGSGANQAALVIDWRDGQEALVWGYRFDTGHHGDMLRAVVEGDPSLFAKMGTFAGFGNFVTGLGYDRNQSGNFVISSGTNFGPSGYTFSGVGEGATATDPVDSYLEAGDVSYWNFWTASGANYPASANWLSASEGIDSIPLADQDWSGFNFVLDFNDPNLPSMPSAAVAAVPEPGTPAWLLLLSWAAFQRKNRNRTHCSPDSRC